MEPFYQVLNGGNGTARGQEVVVDEYDVVVGDGAGLHFDRIGPILFWYDSVMISPGNLPGLRANTKPACSR